MRLDEVGYVPRVFGRVHVVPRLSWVSPYFSRLRLCLPPTSSNIYRPFLFVAELENQLLHMREGGAFEMTAITSPNTNFSFSNRSHNLVGPVRVCGNIRHITLSPTLLISMWSWYNTACSTGSKVLDYCCRWGMENASGRTIVRISIVNDELYTTGARALVGFYFLERSFN